jgi:hypothetical protein
MEDLLKLDVSHSVSTFIRKNSKLCDLLASTYKEQISADLMRDLISHKDTLEYVFFNDKIRKYAQWSDAVEYCDVYRTFRLKCLPLIVGFCDDNEIDKFMEHCDTLNIDTMIHEMVFENSIQCPVFYLSAYSQKHNSIDYEKINMICQTIRQFLNVDTITIYDNYYSFYDAQIIINSRCYPNIYEANKLVDSVINYLTVENKLPDKSDIKKLDLYDFYCKKYTVQCAKALVKREIIKPPVIILSNEPVEVAKRWANNLSESYELSKYSVDDLYWNYISNNFNVIPIRKFNEIVGDLRYRKVKKNGDDYWVPMYGCKEYGIKNDV